jgi:hypothetical protein
MDINLDKQDKGNAGRPRRHFVDYVLHEVSQPITVKLIIRQFGHEGYSIFYQLLEHLGSAKYHCVDISNQEELDLLLLELSTEEKTFNKILSFLVNRHYLDAELLEIGIIFSDEFVKSLNTVYVHRGYPAMTSIDIKKHLAVKREKVAKREKSNKDNDRVVYSSESSEIGITGDEILQTEAEIPIKESDISINEDETLITEAEIIHTPVFNENNALDFNPIDLIDDEPYLRNKARTTGISFDRIKSALTEFVMDSRPGQYTTFGNFNFDFDQVLKNNKMELKALDAAATAYAKPGNTELKQTLPKLLLPEPDNSRLDDICRAVLDDPTWIYNTCLEAKIKQNGYEYHVTKDQQSILIKLFANEHYNQFITIESFKHDFNQWIRDVVL